MNRPKIEDCTREITSYNLNGSKESQKVVDLKKYSFNLEIYCDQLENEIKSLKENFADCIKENKRLKKSFNESIDMLVFTHENGVTDCYEKCPFKEECQADDTMESHCVKAINWKRLVLESD
jgi:hypothetical protein